MSAVLWTIRVLDLAAAVAVGVMLVLAWTAPRRAERRFLLPMLVGVEAWVLGDLIAKSPVGTGVVHAAVTLQLVASGGAVLCLLLFVLAYTGRGDAIRGSTVGFLLVEPVGFGLLALTNPSHRLVIGDTPISATAPPVLAMRVRTLSRAISASETRPSDTCVSA